MSKHIFVDYEGTLSESAKGSGENQKVTISDLLFNDVYSQLKAKENIKQYLLKQKGAHIYVLGIADTYHEMQQKAKWLKMHYPFIKDNNYIFISNNHTKVEIINAYVKYNHIDKTDVIFIDDKQKHLDLAIADGYHCINTNQLDIE